ncbi:DUF4226 domain-containing protein [Mycobacterium sp.]|uniref:DUF4226 domain-containing protein n=1 Tax=Mycobacterium sp. TaxID=1785 RepID=UPI003F967086
MTTYRDVLAVVKQIRDRTGDPNAWQTGLTPNEVVAVVTPTTRPEQLDAIRSRIRQQHPDVFGVAAGDPRVPPFPSDTPPASHEPQQGEAAKAIADAEAALAHQNSASSQLDLQVISAILNAHLKTVEGSEALSKLQQETEVAVRTRSDLDTPAGARDFQRFLISKLRDIRAVVANASLDDTSKSTLMAAWTSLYDASKNEPAVPGRRRPAPATPDNPPAAGPSQQAASPDAAADPYLDSLLDDPGLLADGLPAQDPSAAAPPPPAMPMAPMIPSIPSLGGGSLPGGFSGFSGPGSAPGWNSEGGLPLSRLFDRAEPDPADADEAGDHKDAEAVESSGEKPESPPTGPTGSTGPTVVTLPDGETVTAGSPQLAAAIKAAVGGTPIAQAFHQQGITIPPPGTAVTDPIDPLRVIPGDIGILSDRHALALGHGKALLDGQIQHIATVSGPSFLGWEHPPVTQGPATATAPARTDPPTPTRPAATSPTGD